MSEMLRKLLSVRELLESIADEADGFGYAESLPEIARMQKLERAAFKKINEWSEP